MWQVPRARRNDESRDAPAAAKKKQTKNDENFATPESRLILPREARQELELQ
jgi:hypothetical protein